MGLSASCHMLLIGIGAGDPRQITLEAVEALNRADVFFILDKGAGKDELRHLREAFCQRHIAPERSWRMVVLEDPKRPPVSTAADQGEAYHAVVKAWHRARVSRLTTAIKHHLLPGQTGAFLVWGDPMLYDSMLRLVEQLQATVTGGLEYTVIPGISSVQMLCAAHRIPLNRIGESVTITTGRQLRRQLEHDSAAPHGDTLVMLDGACVFQHVQRDDLYLYWGANMGTASACLMKGPLHEVSDAVVQRREQVRAQAGWVMDVYLLTSH